MSTYAIMTNTGRAKEAAALANGTPLSISEIAWGDGDRDPGGGETTLLNETGRKAVQASGLVDGALNTSFFEVLLDANEGPFIIREAGLFDDEGDMIAIARYDPPVNKPLDSVTALIRIHVVFSDLENLVLNIQSTDAYVPVERTLTAGGGLSGGGDLSVDRTFAVAFATEAEAVAAESTTKVMSPKRVAEEVEALSGAGGNAIAIDDLDAHAQSGFWFAAPSSVGSPSNLHDVRGVTIARGGEVSQFGVLGSQRLAFRDKDTAQGAFGDWVGILNESDVLGSLHSIPNAADAWLVGENFKGDTSVSLEAIEGFCYRVGQLAHITLSLNFGAFSIVASDDSSLSTHFNIVAMAQEAGWFNSLSSAHIGAAYGRFFGPGWDAPWMSFFCSGDAAAGTIYIATSDTTSIPTQTSNATQLEVKLVITALVED